MKEIARAAGLALIVLAAYVAGGRFIIQVAPDWLIDSESNYWGWLAVRVGWAWVCVTGALVWARRAAPEHESGGAHG